MICLAKKGIRNGGAKTRERCSIVRHPSESHTYFAIRSHDLHYEIAMAISHFFLPANCVVVEKTVNICDVCQTRTKSTCLDIPSPGLHDLQDSYLGSSIYMHRLKVLFLQYSRAKLFLSPQSATCVMLWVLYCTVHKLYYETSRVKMTGKEFSTLAQRWRIGRVMYSTPFWVVVTKVEEGWSLVKTCQSGPTTTRNGIEYITRPILHRWASIENSFFCHFHSGCFL